MFKNLMLYYNRLNISKKFKFVSILNIFIAGIIIIVLLFALQYVNERKAAVSEANTFAKILADNITLPIVTGDARKISDILASVEYNDKIRQTFALDRSWKILGAFHKGDDFYKKRQIIPLVRENQNIWKNGSFYCVVPIVNDTVLIGHLVVIASLHDFYIRMAKNSLIIILIIVFAFFMTKRFRQLLQESILQPVSRLDQITTEIIKTKNMDLDIPSFNRDEIGDLACNFKHMLSELNAQKEILSHQAHYDSLTNLPNRTLFSDRINQSIHKAKRQSEKFALLFIDLDQFKEINDTFGHKHGDHLLVKVAKRLKSVIRDEDTLARLGGDEFTIIMSDLKEAHLASVLAQKILDILQLPIRIEGHSVHISCSIGISIFPQDAVESNELLKFADIAMYRAKSDGRNNYHFYTEKMTQQILKRVSMQSKIRRALEKKEFIVYYQPQYNAQTDKIIGLEALVRWAEPKKEVLAPAQFITLAEELGMLIGINNQVMQMTMLQASRWHKEGLDPGRVSINITVTQVEDSNFSNFVESMLMETSCKPEWIALELTEGQIMRSPDLAISTLQELSDLGVKISIDDFGTGYSSLSYLKRLPIDELKIDQSFVQELPGNQDDIAIVQAIIAIAQSMKITVIAEGVETVEQKEFLLSNGCENIQGYFYAQPMTANEITEKLKAATGPLQST